MLKINIFGIKNINEKQLNFNYDEYYRQLGLLLKNVKTEIEREHIKKVEIEKLNKLLEDVDINTNILKSNFINLLLNEKSSQYLWILYSKINNGENYIDKISDVLKQENQVIRGGTNTYKMNGWMTHSLYVYQIVNYNIANNLEIINFKGNKENIEQVKELHDIYTKLSTQAKFILKIFTLIHDIGVIEDIKFHDKLGSKYVEKVLKEIGLNQKTLNQINVLINFSDFTQILQQVIKYHTLITSLSSESNDYYVENEYKKLISDLPNGNCIKQEIPSILFLLAYGDVIAVDESLMDKEKYHRIKDCYNFFKQIGKGEEGKRNKEKVAIERICDMVGKCIQNVQADFYNILEKNDIEKKQFIEDMYNIKLMRYAAPLMKTLNNTEMTIRIYYELFELIGHFEGKEELKKYTIIFVPDRHENEFVKQFKNKNLTRLGNQRLQSGTPEPCCIHNNNFFECIKKMKDNNKSEFTYENINIVKGINEEGKYLHIRVV